MRDEYFSQFVAEIYDAAIDPSLWMGVLEKTAQFVGGPAASFFTRDAVQKKGNSDYYFGTEQGYKQLYFEKYFALDPLNTAYLFLNVGEVVSSSNIISHAELAETRFYKEWMRPQGIVDNVLTLLDKSATTVAGFVVFRHERDGLADEPARERMRLIVPHVRRAALIGGVIDLKAVEAASFADTLSGISAGIFLVNATGRIVHANAAGHAMLGEGGILRATDGRLCTSDPQTDQTLANVFTLAGNGDAAVGVQGIAVPLLARAGERYVAHVLPLTSGARGRAGTRYAAVAALFVHKAALEMPSPLEIIANVFKLTPSELRVMLAIVEVGGVPEASEALGVAETTVKTHLSRLFKKTGTNRQADLVKLMASYTNPLVK